MIKIVLVEDDTNYGRNLINSINRVSGFSCDHSFSDAPTFIKFLEDGGDLDILLLDLRLPGMSGLEALEPIFRLREI
ncbi:MAG: response regulator [Ignavibacteriales bacterium]|nr:response regulator [Ignavibacteriales bacterium]